MAVSQKPFLCRTGLHHRWETATTKEGATFTRCAKCLKEKWTGLDDGRSTTATVITNYGSTH
jgi:hypothetical protein